MHVLAETSIQKSEKLCRKTTLWVGSKNNVIWSEDLHSILRLSFIQTKHLPTACHRLKQAVSYVTKQQQHCCQVKILPICPSLFERSCMKPCKKKTYQY